MYTPSVLIHIEAGGSHGGACGTVMGRLLAWCVDGRGMLAGEGGDVVVVIVWCCGVRSCVCVFVVRGLPVWVGMPDVLTCQAQNRSADLVEVAAMKKNSLKTE